MLTLPMEVMICRHDHEIDELYKVGFECPEMIPVEDIEDAIESGELTEDSRNQGPICAADNKPCIKAIAKLDWIDGPPQEVT